MVEGHPDRELWRMERRNDLLKRRLEWLEGKVRTAFGICQAEKGKKHQDAPV